MKQELLLLGTAPCVSTLCLPDVTARDQNAPSVFAYYKQSNTGCGNALGTSPV